MFKLLKYWKGITVLTSIFFVFFGLVNFLYASNILWVSALSDPTGSAGTGAWFSMTSSSDGTKVAAIDVSGPNGFGGYIWISHDSGSNWTKVNSIEPQLWYSISSSADGTKLVASSIANIGYEGSRTGQIYISNDSGATWTPSTSAGMGSWSSTAYSPDGTKIAISNRRYVYTSSDGGTTWATSTEWTTNTELVDSQAVSSIYFSPDSSKLFALDNSDPDTDYGYIYESSDLGETWSTISSAGFKKWKSICSSNDNSKLFAVENNGYAYMSSDGGTNWATSTALGNKIWSGISCSYSGSVVDLAVYGGYIYTSTNSGLTWATSTSSGARNWLSITGSSDGSKLFAGVNSDYIYNSIDSGTTWTTKSLAGARRWISVSSAVDGQKLVAAVYNGFIYTSDDGGITWNEQIAAGRRTWKSVVYSSDGSKLFALDSYYSPNDLGVNTHTAEGYIYISSDNGATWTRSDSAGFKKWESITSSSNGLNLAAAENFGYIYTSKDGGATWATSTSAGSRGWTSISESSNGSKIYAAEASGFDGISGYIYESMDGGTTWATTTSAGNYKWNSISASGNGAEVFATSETYGSIHFSNDSGATWATSTSAGDNSWNSVTLSSDGERIAAVTKQPGGLGPRGYIYFSSNSGATWATSTTINSGDWSNVSFSGSDTKFITSARNGYIYLGQTNYIPPVISTTTISYSNTTASTTVALIQITTDKNSTPQVAYDITPNYNLIASSTPSQTPSVTLPTVLTCTTYHYQVGLTDVYENTATTSDSSFKTPECAANAAAITSTTTAIDVNSGGSISLNAINIDVPSGYTSVATTTHFEATEISSSTVISTFGSPSTYTLASPVYQLASLVSATSTISSFNKPLRVTFSYDQASVNQFDPSSFVIYTNDDGNWQALNNCAVDTTARTVSCDTNHFSVFSLFGFKITLPTITTHHYGSRSNTNLALATPTYPLLTSNLPTVNSQLSAAEVAALKAQINAKIATLMQQLLKLLTARLNSLLGL